MVQTTLQFLKRDELYNVEKPYLAEYEFDPSDTVPKSNLIISSLPVTINAIESIETFRLDVHGFCVLREKIHLDPLEALRSPDIVESSYIHSLGNILAEQFPEYKRLEPFEFVASRVSCSETEVS